MSRYKFSLSPKIKGYVEWQLEHYHEDKQQLAEMKNDMIPSATASYSLSGGISRGNTSAPTESTAIRIATNPYIQSVERSCKAIETVLSHCDALDRQIINLVYWQRSYTIEGASLKLHYSPRTGYRHINNILCGIALELGLINI